MQLPRKIQHVILATIIVASLVLATFLRATNLAAFHNIQNDEETWVMSGLSLLETGIPQSWTVFWETYGNYHWSLVGGEEKVVVTPYFDHPPLFQLLIGSWGHMVGQRLEAPFDWVRLRIPMIIISIATICVTAWWIYLLFGKAWAGFTLLSFVVLPSHILSSRLIAAEHLIALLLMITLVAVYKSLLRLQHTQIKNIKFNWWFLLVFFCALVAPLIKLSGVVVGLVAVLLLLTRHKYFYSLSVICAMCIGVFAYILYGCYYDCTLFWSVLEQHAARPQTFWYFFTLFSKPDIGYYELADPMLLLGLLGYIVVIFNQESEQDAVLSFKKSFLVIPLLVVILLFMTIAPIELYGWYKFIIFPFIAVGLGFVWQQLFAKDYKWLILLVPAVLVLTENVFGLQNEYAVWRKILTVIFILPIISLLIKPEWRKTTIYKYWCLSVFVFTSILQIVWSVFLLKSF